MSAQLFRALTEKGQFSFFFGEQYLNIMMICSQKENEKPGHNARARSLGGCRVVFPASSDAAGERPMPAAALAFGSRSWARPAMRLTARASRLACLSVEASGH